MAFQYGGITYHTDEPNPTPLRDLITGAGLPGSGTASYYAPLTAEQLAKYTTGGGTTVAGGSEGGSAAQAPAINWQAMPGTAFGPAYAVNPVEPGVKLFNPALQGRDANYGQITPTANVNNAQFSDLLGPIIGSILGAGFGGLSPLGSIGGSIFNTITKGLFNQGGNQGTNPLAAILAILSRMRG